MRRSTLTFVGTLFWIAQALSGAALFNYSLPANDPADNGDGFSTLNDHIAGSRGNVTVGVDGHLYAGGQRLRFWGANMVAGGAFPASYLDADAVAARLAKFGVNIVRFHHMDNDWGGPSIWQDQSDDRALNPVSQDRMDYLFNALKQQGIYSNINLVVSRPLHPGTELDPSISLITDSKIKEALGFFDPAQLQLQKDYARDLLTHVNPYTGLSYAQDPAVAFVEVNNENGMVQAWMSQQLDSLPAYYADLLNTQWNNWLTLKYGTEAVLESNWGVTNAPLGAEKLTNGGFNGGTTAGWNWELNGSPAAAGTATVTADGAGGTLVAKLTVTSVGQQSWHVQFDQINLSVTAGTPYTLEFWAKADSNRSIALDLMQGHSPWGGLGFSSTLNLTSSWQKFSYVLSPSATDANARVNFGGMGLQTGTVWIGSVSFKPGGVLGLYPGEAIGGAGMRSFLRNGESVARTTEGRRDWLRFLLQTEEAYWQSLRDYLRTTLGVQALLMGTIQGCSTPNAQALFDAIDSHFYWHHPAFPGIPWDPVNWYIDNAAMVDDPANGAPAAIGTQAVLGKPHSVTELNTPYPHTYEADVQLITAAYGGLNDWDAIYPFAHWGSESGYNSTDLEDFFTLGYNPVKMAGELAAAAAFRRGDFSPAGSLVAVPFDRASELEQLLTASAWSLVNAGTAGEDKRAVLKHRVRLLIEGQTAPGGSLSPGTSGPYNSSGIAADTGQLNWQTGGVGGLVTGNSARTQFAAGFLNGRTLAFGSLTVTAVDSLQSGDYAVISLSSRDGLPLTATASALLTVLGCQRNTGSTYYTYPSTVTSFPPAKGALITLRDQRGTGPVQAEGVSATVTLGYPYADVQVYALLPDGSRGSNLPVANAGGLAQVVVGPVYQTLLYEVAVAHASYSPTPTRTATPVLTATPTRTLTATPSITPIPASVVWDDAETGAVPQSWQAFVDTSTGSILGVNRLTGTAVAAGNYAEEVQFNSGSAGNWGGGYLVNSPYGTKPSLGYRDLAGMQVLRIKLWTNTAGLKVRPTLSEAGNTATPVAGGDGEVWESANGAWTVLPANTWVDLSFPLSAFRDKPNYPYNPTSLGDNTMDLSAVAWITLEWDGNQGAGVVLRVDDVLFERDLGTATPTRTFSPTRTVTPTASPSRTPSATPTASQSFTETPLVSPTATPSSSPVRTATPSATPTASATATHTPSVTPTATPSGGTAPVDPGGALKVLEQRCMPQPLRGGIGRLYVKLEGGAEALDWKLYSQAHVLLFQQRLLGPFAAGWSHVAVALPELPNGLSYSVLTATRGAERSAGQKARIYVLR